MCARVMRWRARFCLWLKLHDARPPDIMARRRRHSVATPTPLTAHPSAPMATAATDTPPELTPEPPPAPPPATPPPADTDTLSPIATGRWSRFLSSALEHVQLAEYLQRNEAVAAFFGAVE